MNLHSIYAVCPAGSNVLGMKMSLYDLNQLSTQPVLLKRFGFLSDVVKPQEQISVSHNVSTQNMNTLLQECVKQLRRKNPCPQIVRSELDCCNLGLLWESPSAFWINICDDSQLVR